MWIPKLYNGKNKTFFFFNLERYRDREALYAGITTVPNSAYLSGNLSNNLAVTGEPEPGDRFRGPTDHPERHLRSRDGDHRFQRTAGAERVSEQRHSAEPHRPGGGEDHGACCPSRISATIYVNNFAQSGAFYQAAADSLDQDRSQLQRQDQALRLLRHSKH